MKSFAVLALSGMAAAVPHVGHAAFHKKDVLDDMKSGLENLAADFSASLDKANTLLTKLGAKGAANSQDPTETSWVGIAKPGSDAVVNTIWNQGKEDTVFTCWGTAGSWINANKPTVAVTVKAGKNVTISHAIGTDGKTNTGGCAPVDSNTVLKNGQVYNTWLEYNWLVSEWGSSTFDVSMEVNPNGRNMTVQGPKCTSSYDKCSFHCNDASAEQCGEAGTYFLKNCEAGSQPAASAGQFGGQASGGCQGIANTGITNILTILH